MYSVQIDRCRLNIVNVRSGNQNNTNVPNLCWSLQAQHGHCLRCEIKRRSQPGEVDGDMEMANGVNQSPNNPI